MVPKVLVAAKPGSGEPELHALSALVPAEHLHDKIILKYFTFIIIACSPDQAHWPGRRSSESSSGPGVCRS